MEQIIASLEKIGNSSDQKGLTKIADGVTSVMSNLLQIKTAQYVGLQGYWIRNGRCWQNCYRQKRAASPDTPAQTVWMECHSEYLESINDPKAEWNKYADEDDSIVKTSNKDFQKEDDLFRRKLASRLAHGQDIQTAVEGSMSDGAARYEDSILANANEVADLAIKVSEAGHDELVVKLSQVSQDLIKEAQFWENLKGLGNQIGNKAKGLFGGGDPTSGVGMDPQNLFTVISQLENTLNGYQKQYDTLSKTLQTMNTMGGKGPAVAKQLAPLMKRLNTESIQQMKAIAQQWTNEAQAEENVGGEQAAGQQPAAGVDPASVFNQEVGQPESAIGESTGIPEEGPMGEEHFVGIPGQQQQGEMYQAPEDQAQQQSQQQSQQLISELGNMPQDQLSSLWTALTQEFKKRKTQSAAPQQPESDVIGDITAMPGQAPQGNQYYQDPNALQQAAGSQRSIKTAQVAPMDVITYLENLKKTYPRLSQHYNNSFSAVMKLLKKQKQLYEGPVTETPVQDSPELGLGTDIDPIVQEEPTYEPQEIEPDPFAPVESEMGMIAHEPLRNVKLGKFLDGIKKKGFRK